MIFITGSCFRTGGRNTCTHLGQVLKDEQGRAEKMFGTLQDVTLSENN